MLVVRCTCAGSGGEGRGGGISGYSCFNSGLKEGVEGSRGLSRFMGYGIGELVLLIANPYSFG